MSLQLQTVTSNLRTNRCRRAMLHGREHIVAPVTLLVPGVLNGSHGPLYYPREEIAHDFQAWNGMPLVVYHPNDGGRPTSARDPNVLNASGVGLLLQTFVDNLGRLRGMGWFDIESTRRVDKRILYALEAGRPIEVSTGLFTDNEDRAGSYRGTAFDFIARNYRPDHLAILPDKKGACSIKDGCGVLVNRSASVPSQVSDQSGRIGFRANGATLNFGSFDESKHKRDKGKFSSTGGSSSGTKLRKPRKRMLVTPSSVRGHLAKKGGLGRFAV